MKWFKHNSDAHTNLKTGAVIAEYGVGAYGFWWLCVELVAHQGDMYALGADKNWKRGLMRVSGASMEDIDTWLAFFADERLIDAEALARGELHIPNLAEYCDDYSSRSVRTKSQSVRTKSDKVPLEEKRKEEKRKEEKDAKPTSRLAWLTAIPDDDLKELSEKYEASPAQVQRKADDLKNYCESKGKSYKNYRAFLENALQKDFGRRTAPAITGYERTENGMRPVFDPDQVRKLAAEKRITQ